MAVFQAGLPNITGWFAVAATLAADNALFKIQAETSITATGSDTKPTTINFNANYANSIYGSSETVQPPALSLIPQIKY